MATKKPTHPIPVHVTLSTAPARAPFSLLPSARLPGEELVRLGRQNRGTAFEANARALVVRARDSDGAPYGFGAAWCDAMTAALDVIDHASTTVRADRLARAEASPRRDDLDVALTWCRAASSLLRATPGSAGDVSIVRTRTPAKVLDAMRDRVAQLRRLGGAAATSLADEGEKRSDRLRTAMDAHARSAVAVSDEARAVTWQRGVVSAEVARLCRVVRAAFPEKAHFFVLSTGQRRRRAKARVPSTSPAPGTVPGSTSAAGAPSDAPKHG